MLNMSTYVTVETKQLSHALLIFMMVLCSWQFTGIVFFAVFRGRDVALGKRIIASCTLTYIPGNGGRHYGFAALTRTWLWKVPDHCSHMESCPSIKHTTFQSLKIENTFFCVFWNSSLQFRSKFLSAKCGMEYVQGSPPRTRSHALAHIADCPHVRKR